MEEIDQFIKSLLDDLKNNRLKLPTLPQVAVKITNTIDDPNSTARNITRIVASDAALSARLIQIANSAMYRTNTPVEDVQTAITRLGMKQVRNISSSLLIKQLFHTKYAGLKKRLERLWSHSAHVAAICAVFSKKHKNVKPDEAMLAGLVHDIGQLPIMSYAEKYPAIANDDNVLTNVALKIGPTLGKTMLQAWKFAPSILTVVAEHENLSRDHDGPPDLCDLVTVANLHSHIGTTHPLAHVNWADVPALKKLGLSPEDSIEAMKEARDEILELRNLLTT